VVYRGGRQARSLTRAPLFRYITYVLPLSERHVHDVGDAAHHAPPETIATTRGPRRNHSWLLAGDIQNTFTFVVIVVAVVVVPPSP